MVCDAKGSSFSTQGFELLIQRFFNFLDIQRRIKLFLEDLHFLLFLERLCFFRVRLSGKEGNPCGQ